ncbi:MAG: hypothetical protein ACODAD_04940 [Planctomycetota bacterium]
MTSALLRNLRTTVGIIIRAKGGISPACHKWRSARYRAAVSLLAGWLLLALGTRSLLASKPPSAPPNTSATPAPLNWGHNSAAAPRGTVQHNLSVATRDQPRSNSPGPEHSPPPEQHRVTVLRWRAPNVAQARVTTDNGADPDQAATTASPAEDRYPVRQVSATEQDLPRAIPDATHSPVKNPRGDRDDATVGSRQEPASLEIHPATNRGGQQPPSEHIAKTIWQNDPPPKPPREIDPPQDAETFPVQAGLSQPNRPGTEESGTGAAGETEPCQRIHNRRNCCEEGEECEQSKEKWQRAAISKISLDITPEMHPEETDPVTRTKDRNETLSRSEPRIWHDREGHVLAEGRLTDIERNRLLILNADNQIVRIHLNELSEDDLCFVTAWWHLPTECTLGDESHAGRNWAPSTLTWKATAACHKPLYFEDRELERHGHTAGPFKQPFLSGATFLGKLLTVPYQTGINPPWECQYELGHYRPGSCAPWLVPPLPLSVRGALSQAGTVVGGVNLFP